MGYSVITPKTYLYSDFVKLIFPSLTHTCMTQLKTQLLGGKLVGYLQSVVDLTQGPPTTNPESGQSGI